MPSPTFATELCDKMINDKTDIPVACTLLGLGDSGAHVMSVTNYRYPTFLLAELVVRREALPIELAIRSRTSPVAAESNRGTLNTGRSPLKVTEGLGEP